MTSQPAVLKQRNQWRTCTRTLHCKKVRPGSGSPSRRGIVVLDVTAGWVRPSSRSLWSNGALLISLLETEYLGFGSRESKNQTTKIVFVIEWAARDVGHRRVDQNDA
jgi:hypothetical protein